ncbi:MAG: exodeoxyribonuclease VII large subunit [Chloroflexi bacterium]|nr:exodeoxyribonuclease VII large subunit [Chloroflexota bacterium]
MNLDISSSTNLNLNFKDSISVTELNYLIKSILDFEPSLQEISVLGEVSNSRVTPKNHIFFNLIDQSSSIPCVMWSSDFNNGRENLYNGNLVLCSGKISTYFQTGMLQLYINNVQKSGNGEIQKEFNELKNKLRMEGLFDQNRKRKITKFPKKICVITSKNGAVFKDIINVITRRYPLVEINLIPVPVQGKDSVEKISHAIEEANTLNFDTIIIARGGGSIEDLGAFNDENLARKIFSSSTPIISAVGHETDYTISDYVSDLRAPTPSAAAELAVPSYIELLKEIESFKNILNYTIKEKISEDLRTFENNLDRFLLNTPVLSFYQEKIDTNLYQLTDSICQFTKTITHRLEITINSLKFLNPSDTISRGLVQTKNSQNKIVKSIQEINKGDTITISYLDGEAVTKVISK